MADRQQRFEDKFEEGQPDECWLWQASTMTSGHGYFDQTSAHRIAYELEHGEVPDDAHVLHKCGTRHCVNPRHLYVGSHDDNMQDRLDDGNYARGEAATRGKLTVDEVRQIRSADATYGELADQYDVSKRTINDIVNHNTWTHIDND